MSPKTLLAYTLLFGACLLAIGVLGIELYGGALR